MIGEEGGGIGTLNAAFGLDCTGIGYELLDFLFLCGRVEGRGYWISCFSIPKSSIYTPSWTKSALMLFNDMGKFTHVTLCNALRIDAIFSLYQQRIPHPNQSTIGFNSIYSHPLYP